MQILEAARSLAASSKEKCLWKYLQMFDNKSEKKFATKVKTKQRGTPQDAL